MNIFVAGPQSLSDDNLGGKWQEVNMFFQGGGLRPLRII